MMLTYMLLYSLTPHIACNMQNGAPVHNAKSTLRRWWKHFEVWGEKPVATARRLLTLLYKMMSYIMYTGAEATDQCLEGNHTRSSSCNKSKYMCIR